MAIILGGLFLFTFNLFFVCFTNIKVIRAPMAGMITSITYIEGKLRNADFDKACGENECNKFTLESSGEEKFFLAQAAGLIASCIVSYVKVGDKMVAGNLSWHAIKVKEEKYGR